MCSQRKGKVRTHSKKAVVCKPGKKGLTKHQGHLDLRLLASGVMRKQISVVNTTHLWYFVVVAEENKLQGDYIGKWECHIQSDWLLIWEQFNNELRMMMTNTGSHSELFGK